MPTRSEQLFDAYCVLRAYTSTPIAAGSAFGRTPDRLVTTPVGQVVVEIKELTANADDMRQLRELREQGWTHGGGTPGARVFEQIRSAAPQLKRYADRRIPCAIVLYDNIVLDRDRLGGKHLAPEFIDFGMYGLQTVLLAPESSKRDARLVAVGSGRGPRRQMSQNSRLYVSAVQVLRESLDAEEPFLITCHNYFARWPLSRVAFRGPLDRHFVKPAHPNESPQSWSEASAQSAAQ